MTSSVSTVTNGEGAMKGLNVTAPGLNAAIRSASLPSSTTSSNSPTENMAAGNNNGARIEKNHHDPGSIRSIKTDLTYLSHHIYRLVLALQVPPCTCRICNVRHVTQSNLILNLAQDQQQSADNNQAAADQQLPKSDHSSQQLVPNNGYLDGENDDRGSVCHTPLDEGTNCHRKGHSNGLTVVNSGSGVPPQSGQIGKDYDTDLSSSDGNTPSTPRTEPAVVDVTDCLNLLLGTIGAGLNHPASMLNGMTMETLAAGLTASLGTAEPTTIGMNTDKLLEAALLTAAAASSGSLSFNNNNLLSMNGSNNNGNGLQTAPFHPTISSSQPGKLLSKNSLGNGSVVSANNNFTAGGNVGRRSKYCTPEEKAAVAAYAVNHGASAAARKFNIPPAVAAYYHRKTFSKGLPTKSRKPPIGEGSLDIDEATPVVSPLGDQRRKSTETTSSMMNVLLSSDPYYHNAATTMVPGGANNNVRGGNFHGPPIPQQMDNSDAGSNPLSMSYEAQKMCHSINTTGNNGMWARVGTGKRGRPKLIGDDLDAELLTYLVNLRRRSNHFETKISAENILRICSGFIRQRRPGLLTEDGGNVQLRQTWAVKMLMRMNEWERLLPENNNGGGGEDISGSSSSNNNNNDEGSTVTTNRADENDVDIVSEQNEIDNRNEKDRNESETLDKNAQTADRPTSPIALQLV